MKEKTILLKDGESIATISQDVVTLSSVEVTEMLEDHKKRIQWILKMLLWVLSFCLLGSFIIFFEAGTSTLSCERKESSIFCSAERNNVFLDDYTILSRSETVAVELVSDTNNETSTSTCSITVIAATGSRVQLTDSTSSGQCGLWAEVDRFNQFIQGKVDENHKTLAVSDATGSTFGFIFIALSVWLLFSYATNGVLASITFDRKKQQIEKQIVSLFGVSRKSIDFDKINAVEYQEKKGETRISAYLLLKPKRGRKKYIEISAHANEMRKAHTEINRILK